jgi:hypothetical protein
VDIGVGCPSSISPTAIFCLDVIPGTDPHVSPGFPTFSPLPYLPLVKSCGRVSAIPVSPILGVSPKAKAAFPAPRITADSLHREGGLLSGRRTAMRESKLFRLQGQE